MKIEQLKPVTVNEKVTTGYKCDVCGTEHRSDTLPDGWHHFNQHHSDWGVNSGESYQYFDVCSAECFLVHMEHVILDEYGQRKSTGVISGFSVAFAIKLVNNSSKR